MAKSQHEEGKTMSPVRCQNHITALRERHRDIQRDTHTDRDIHTHTHTCTKDNHPPPLLNCSLKPVMLREMSVLKTTVRTLEVEVMGEELGTRPQNLPTGVPLLVAAETRNGHSDLTQF